MKDKKVVKMPLVDPLVFHVNDFWSLVCNKY